MLGGIVGCPWAFDISAPGYETRQITIPCPASRRGSRPSRCRSRRPASGASPELQAAAAKADAAYKEGRFAEARAEYEKLVALPARSRPDRVPADRLLLRPGEAVRQGRRSAREGAGGGSRQCPDPARSPRRRRSRARWSTRPEEPPLGPRRGADPEPGRLLQHGHQLLQRRRGEGRDRLLRKTVAKDPAYVDAYYRRALAYLGQGQMAEAKADFQKVVELQPERRDGDGVEEGARAAQVAVTRPGPRPRSAPCRPRPGRRSRAEPVAARREPGRSEARDVALDPVGVRHDARRAGEQQLLPAPRGVDELRLDLVLGSLPSRRAPPTPSRRPRAGCR